MTGQDVSRIFDREVLKAYSVFYNGTKKNDLFRQALVLSIEDRYKMLDSESTYDDIISVIKTEKRFLLNNNVIYTSPLNIIGIVRVGTNFIIETNLPHNVIVGDEVVLDGITGFNTALDGPYTVTSFSFSPTQFSVSNAYSGGAWTQGTGHVVGHNLGGVDKMAADYSHVLSISARYEMNLSYKVKNVLNTDPIRIELDTINHNVVDGDFISVSGVLVNTNANGDRYVKKVSRKSFALYYDSKFLNPVAANGVSKGLPSIKRVFYNYAIPKISIEKISNYDSSNMQRPEFENGDKLIKISPREYVCSEITMDYISDAVVFIDVNDNVEDLLDTYPESFMNYVISKAVQMYAAEVKSASRYQTAAIEIQNANTK